ncbi:MAG: TraR/DksA family transcriptional regulator [Acidiferrobacter sp.]
MANLTPSDLKYLTDKLTVRRSELEAMVRADAACAGHDNLRRMGGEVGDPGDESAALQQTDLNLAEMEGGARELQAIDRALERVREGRYGHCAECGCDIPAARLDAYPAAERCTPCQTRHERVYGGRDVTPSL